MTPIVLITIQYCQMMRISIVGWQCQILFKCVWEHPWKVFFITFNEKEKSCIIHTLMKHFPIPPDHCIIASFFSYSEMRWLNLENLCSSKNPFSGATPHKHSNVCEFFYAALYMMYKFYAYHIV